MINDPESLFWIRPGKGTTDYDCSICEFTVEISDSDKEDGAYASPLDWGLIFEHLRSEEHYYQWELERLAW